MDRSVSSKNDRPFSPKGSTADGIDHKLDKIELQLSQLRSKQFENLELEMEWKRREVIDVFFILIDDHCSVHQLSKHAQYTHARPYFNWHSQAEIFGGEAQEMLGKTGKPSPKEERQAAREKSLKRMATPKRERTKAVTTGITSTHHDEVERLAREGPG